MIQINLILVMSGKQNLNNWTKFYLHAIYEVAMYEAKKHYFVSIWIDY